MLVARTQQDHDCRSALYIVDPISWTIVDPHLHDTAADAFRITKIPLLNATNPGDDTCDSVVVFQTPQPVGEFGGPINVDHAKEIVAYRLLRHKASAHAAAATIRRRTSSVL